MLRQSTQQKLKCELKITVELKSLYSITVQNITHGKGLIWLVVI